MVELFNNLLTKANEAFEDQFKPMPRDELVKRAEEYKKKTGPLMSEEDSDFLIEELKKLGYDVYGNLLKGDNSCDELPVLDSLGISDRPFAGFYVTETGRFGSIRLSRYKLRLFFSKYGYDVKYTAELAGDVGEKSYYVRVGKKK